ncbi:MAG: CRISPR-associated endonuclease Cas2 [Chloroflexi bacterium]|nr:CRISPR-associated endonuclease Cas2 [Chloroflexota bacterium]
MTKKFIVVAYDISDDKRRTRLHKRLLDFGTPVQYSVFECLLVEKDFARMERAVRRVIKPRLDQVRYYFLCETCRSKIETTSGVQVVKEVQVIVV